MRVLSITLKPPKKNAEFLTSENVNRVMGIKEWGLVIVLSIIWGGSFFFTGVAIKEVTPLTIVFSRVGFASIILLAIVYLKGGKMPSSLKGLSIEAIGQIAVLGAALSYACAAIYGRRFEGVDPVVVAAGMLCGSTITMAPLSLFIEQPWNLTPSVMTMAALLGQSAISTSLAYIIYFRVLATSGPTNLMLVTFLIPISAILLGVMVLGEQPGLNAFVGMGMIFIGLIAIDGRLITRFRPKEIRFCETC